MTDTSHSDQGAAVVRRMARRTVDLVLLGIALYAAYLVRFDWSVPTRSAQQFGQVLVFVVGLQYLLLARLRATHGSWRYVSISDLGLLVRALYVAAASFAILRLVGPQLMLEGLAGQLTSIPLGVVAINFLTAVVLLGGARAARRSMSEAVAIKRVSGGEVKRTALIGAGEAGVAVARQMRLRPDLGAVPVAFIDDDAKKWGQRIHGVDVLGGVDALPKLIQDLEIDELLITVDRPPGELVRRLGEVAEVAGVSVRKVSGLADVVAGRAVLRPRAIELDDLLRRDTVATDLDGLARLVAGRSVLVTGAGGSIGSELCRQLLSMRPSALVMVERNENALYEIDRELRPHAGAADLVCAVGDITDRERMDEVLTAHGPEIVFHAAAHKHVPMMELNPAEAVKNNVFGTRRLVDACVAAKVPRFVLISTDKAVNPTSIMGATKRVAERYVTATAQDTGLAYSAVRFGNVLGSNGSVVPLFRQQIEKGGPITVTHPEVRRYFMTIPEAVQLVLQASLLGEGADVFVLDMGEQIPIVDLAKDLIKLSGLQEGTDIRIEFVGLRPGEKLYEELGLGTEDMRSTEHPKIFRWTGQDQISRGELSRVFDAIDLDRARVHLGILVPEFTGGQVVQDA